MVSAIHLRLREETRSEHERLEARADILARIASPTGRRDVVAGFHRLHADVEAAIAPWLEDLPGLDFAQRRRTVQLNRDLEALGVRPLAADPDCAPQATGLGEALGLAYVLEGSTLGGQVIRRQARASGDDLAGLSFLDPYGARVGERWRSFLAVLDAAARTDETQAAVVQGARACFRHAELSLCGADLGASAYG